MELKYYQILTVMVKHKEDVISVSASYYTQTCTHTWAIHLSCYNTPPHLPSTHAYTYYIFPVDTHRCQGYDVYYLQLWLFLFMWQWRMWRAAATTDTPHCPRKQQDNIIREEMTPLLHIALSLFQRYSKRRENDFGGKSFTLTKHSLNT